MGRVTRIEWSEATWNVSWGCSKVSEGCKNCYAERIARQYHVRGSHTWKHAFDFRLAPQRLTDPLHWRQPRMIFVDSMSDLFHEQMADAYLAQVWAVMEKCPQHTFQILTKRPERMFRFFAEIPFYERAYLSPPVHGIPLPNVWLGVSVEFAAYRGRIDVLRQCPAVVHFVSFEPLLGDVTPVDLTHIEWIIVGGESDYRQPRPMKPEWAQKLRDAAISRGIPFFFKQVGGKRKCACHGAWGCRLLDGRLWDEMPLIERPLVEFTA